TVKVPSLCADSLIQYASPLCAGAGGPPRPAGGGGSGATGIAASGSSARLAMNSPGAVYSCPLNSEKCICHTSSRPGEEYNVFITPGGPPLRVPLFMIATRGRSAWTITSEFDVSTPWWRPRNASTVPMRFAGHISSNSLFFVRSPRWTVRKRPKVTCTPTDIGSSALLSPGLKLAQYGFGAPAPASGVLMVSPADVTTTTFSPAIGILSPGLATVCVAFSYSFG